jgi:hypothetical protein
MRFPNRRTFWLGIALLLAVVGGAGLLVPRNQITQEKFDRIQEGMDTGVAEIEAILGPGGRWTEWTPVGGRRPAIGAPLRLNHREHLSDFAVVSYELKSGASSISLVFLHGRVVSKDSYLATSWETLTWYAKKCAAKIGVKWD